MQEDVFEGSVFHKGQCHRSLEGHVLQPMCRKQMILKIVHAPAKHRCYKDSGPALHDTAAQASWDRISVYCLWTQTNMLHPLQKYLLLPLAACCSSELDQPWHCPSHMVLPSSGGTHDCCSLGTAKRPICPENSSLVEGIAFPRLLSSVPLSPLARHRLIKSPALPRSIPGRCIK